MNTAELTSLLNVSRPSALVALKWTDKEETSLPAIKGFKNLTELDLTGNQLFAGLPELHSLKYLKKLTLARNGIHSLWDFPKNLEHLNLADNQIEVLTMNLSRLKTLDVSRNRLQSLNGIEFLESLNSLYASENQVSEVVGIEQLPHILEIDLSCNLLSLSNAGELFSVPSLAAINLKGNAMVGDVIPPEEWILDTDLLFYRDPNRLKSLKTSRFRREIKRKQESYDIVQDPRIDSFSSSPSRLSKRTGFSDDQYEANSSTRKFMREAFRLRPGLEHRFGKSPDEAEEQEASLRSKSIEALWDEVIEYCHLPVSQHPTGRETWDKYERAVQLLKERENERIDLLSKLRTFESSLESAHLALERDCMNLSDLEAAYNRLKETTAAQIADMKTALSDLIRTESPPAQLAVTYIDDSLMMEFHPHEVFPIQEDLGNEPLTSFLDYRQSEYLSDSRKNAEDSGYDRSFVRHLENGKFLVSKSLGKYIERLKTTNIRLREKLHKVKAQRDRYGDALKRYEANIKGMDIPRPAHV